MAKIQPDPEITAAIESFLNSVHPYDSLSADERKAVAAAFQRIEVAAGDSVYFAGQKLKGLYLIEDGQIEVIDANGAAVSNLLARNSFGERGLLREGVAVTSARAEADSRLLLLPKPEFDHLIAESAVFRRFFDRARAPVSARKSELATQKLGEIMSGSPISVRPATSIKAAAALMRDTRLSCLLVTEPVDRLVGLITSGDMVTRALAVGLPPEAPVSEIMTPAPLALPPSALGSDLLNIMLEKGIGHVPVVEADKLVGILTQTDLTRFQALSSASLVRDVARANSPEEMAAVTARLPQLLMQLVGAGNRHEVVTRLVTDIADACTRRLLALAEARLGRPPVPYLWLACGSQGRQEQTGVSDQDNCLILDDAAGEDDAGYFTALADYVCSGLDICGYMFCPGDMMASNPRWRVRLSEWRGYFKRWIDAPDPTAQMLASVMFDLRPISGETSLFDNLQSETLQAASENSIFVSHMISNSLKHTPPLGLFRGFATVRSGEHKNEVDLKHNGVVPVVDLGRVYALQGRLIETNTRARLEAAEAAGVISSAGGRELVDAYDLIAETRLRMQADEIRADQTPDNFMAPSDLSDLERSHLRDAFVVVRTMQSAIGQGRGFLG